MKVFCILTLLCFTLTSFSGIVLDGNFVVTDKYPGGFTGKIQFPARIDYRYGWLINITFDVEVLEFEVYEGAVIGVHPSNKQFIVQHKEYNMVLHRDSLGVKNFFCQGRCQAIPTAEIQFIPMQNERETVEEALFRALQTGVTGETPPTSSAAQTMSAASTTASVLEEWWPPVFEPVTARTQPGSTTPTQSTTSSTTRPPPDLGSLNLRYNLRDVITKSLLFIEAQRSGLLPDGNRIPWRSHSALRDGSDRQLDLSGGYYVDGGFVKYGFPMAFSTTMLAWGVLEFRNAYLASQQIPYVMNALKWATDYFIKCHVTPFEYFGQVSKSDVDEKYWGRPEDFKGRRPSFKITTSDPGSDLAAETAAALAATAIVFNGTNSTYSSELMMHARQLLRFAERYRGKYHESIPDAAKHYKSWSGYWDELAWGALWVYKATNEEVFLDVARTRMSSNPDTSDVESFSWDDKRAGATMLLAQITGEPEYMDTMMDFCDGMLPGRGIPYTPRGLLYIDEWGTNRHASNVAVLCVMAANLGIRPDIYRRFAHRQLSYILGDGGRSYVVGFGETPPTRPYHRASSCQDPPAPCSWDDKDADRPNPQILTGALVAGPDKWDSFSDDRNDFQHNAVALDFNAGFQTLAAGILELQVTGETFSEPNPEELNSAVSESFSIRHDYSEVLHKSLLFYEAQRSGELPDDNRVPWRRSAFVNDVGNDGEDLSGGYFDAGDYVKFNFPMAYAATVLSWGVVRYRESYEVAGELGNVRKAIKWATDYFIKCHVSKYELYGQVGSGVIDHSHWRTPEGMESVSRPSYKLTSRDPGSELVAETAAAMAAASIVFQESDPEYAGMLVGRARDLYEFADKYREMYHRSIRDAERFYRSHSGYEDELVWAALWLYNATGEEMYLNDAIRKYRQFGLSTDYLQSFSWDEKTAGVQLLLYQITNRTEYRESVQTFCDRFLPENGHTYTPRGLVFINEWGPLRHAASVSFICMGAADLHIRPEKYREFAKRQLHYMLGDSGLGSYVVGYGPNPPTRPHHRTSSCPNPPAPCGFSALHTSTSNPHVLYGALMGGPDENDQFTDDRNNYKSNEVALDYNAAFQSAIAGLIYLELHPPSTPEPPTTPMTPRAQEVTSSSSDDDDDIVTDGIPDFLDLEGWFADYEGIIEELNFTAGNHNTGPPDVASPATSDANLTSAANDVTSAPVTSSYQVLNTTKVASDATEFEATSTSVTTGAVTMTTAYDVHTNAGSTVAMTSLQTTGTPTTPAQTTTRPAETTTTPSETTTSPPRVIRLTRPSYVLSHPENVIYRYECRPVDVFNLCSIDKYMYKKHKASSKFFCRYDSFKACSNLQGQACEEVSLWTIFSYWNSDVADDRVYFSDEELKCKDPQIDALELCQVTGITRTFDDCYASSAPANHLRVKLGLKSCKFAEFQKCANKLLNHCRSAWNIWKHWNVKTNTRKPYFSSKEQECVNSANRTSKQSSFIFCAFLVNILYSYVTFT